MNNTKIEWCSSTWNPVTGCLHGCHYCYARGIANRFGCHKKATQEKEYVLDEPYKVDGNRVPYPFDFAPTFHKYRLGEYENKESRTIFVCSMADLFGEWVPDEWIKAVFAACEKAPQHKYLFLTKNPERYERLCQGGELKKSDNMWYGSTMTNPENDFYIDNMRNTFLSIEPLLKPFPIGNALQKDDINWIIIGAETGNRKNKVVPRKEWIDNICKTADIFNIPVFMKESCVPIIGEENMRREFPWAVV